MIPLKPILCAAVILPVGSTQAAFTLLSNFEGMTAGALGTQGGWTSDAQYTVVADPAGGSNQVLQFVAGGQGGAFLPLGANSVNNTSSSTLFARFRFNATANANFGLSDVAAPAAYGDFEVQVNRQNGTPIKGRDAAAFVDLATPLADNVDTWYNIWAIADNTTDSTRIFIQSDTDVDFASQIEVFTTDGTMNFRNGTTASLVNLMLRAQEGTAFYDDFYISPGTDLSNPVSSVPEPSSLALLVFGGAALLRRKRK